MSGTSSLCTGTEYNTLFISARVNGNLLFISSSKFILKVFFFNVLMELVLESEEMLHVVDSLDGELVSSPVRADGDGGELQLLQLHSVDGAGAWVRVPVSEQGRSLFWILPSLGMLLLQVSIADEEAEEPAGECHDEHPDDPVDPVVSIHKVPYSMDGRLLHDQTAEVKCQVFSPKI